MAQQRKKGRPAAKVAREPSEAWLLRRGQAAIAKRFEAAHPERQVVFGGPSGNVRMSDLLTELVAPFHTEDIDEQAYRALLGLGAVAWNATLLPAEASDGLLRDALKSIPWLERALFRRLLNDMMARKRELFGGCRRLILGWELTVTAQTWHVAVASEPESGQAQPKR
jgi:hypothetical protein